MNYLGIEISDSKHIKKAEKHRIFLEQTFQLTVIFDFIKYLSLLNYFHLNGFDLAQIEKEMVYIEILETDDEKLINKLEEILELKENLQKLNWNLINYKIMLEDMQHNENS